MKKLAGLVLTFGLLVLVAAFTQCSLAIPAGPDTSLQEQIVAKEKEELDTLKSGNSQAFAALIDEQAIFVDPRGLAGKAEVVSHVADFRLLEYSFLDLEFRQLTPDTGLIAYTLTEKGNAHGHEFTAKAHASAVWSKRSGTWLCLFSQETPAREGQSH